MGLRVKNLIKTIDRHKGHQLQRLPAIRDQTEEKDAFLEYSTIMKLECIPPSFREFPFASLRFLNLTK